MTPNSLDYQTIVALHRDHPGWRLLRADHAPLAIAVLYRHFVQPNVRVLGRAVLASKLDDDLFRLREQLGSGTFPRTAEAYLDEWAADDKGWLRKYYSVGNDESQYDLSPSTERVIAWIAELQDRHFVGTESRLLTVFELLRQIVEGSELDPDARIAELEKRKAEIDSRIARIRDGQLMLMDPSQVKDRFLQMAATARGLLSDFRDLEQSFRELDRTIRERIALWDERRGTLLDAVFEERDAIEDSDQGKSFRAFWDFLMSPDRQEELSALLTAVMALDAVQSLSPDPRLLRIHYDWLEAGETTQRTVARLSQQLSRYLDDQAYAENRRIMQLIRSVEQHALALRGGFPDGPSTVVASAVVGLELPMERPLFTLPFKAELSDEALVAGNEEIDTRALFEQTYVDKERLAGNIRRALHDRDQVTLEEIVAEYPLHQGLAELVAYLSLAADDRRATIHDADPRTIAWTDEDGVSRRATMPLVVFVGRTDADRIAS